MRGAGCLAALIPSLPLTRIVLYLVQRLTQWGLCSSNPQGSRLPRTLDRCASDMWGLFQPSLPPRAVWALGPSMPLHSKTALGSPAPNPDLVSWSQSFIKSVLIASRCVTPRQPPVTFRVFLGQRLQASVVPGPVTTCKMLMIVASAWEGMAGLASLSHKAYHCLALPDVRASVRSVNQMQQCQPCGSREGCLFCCLAAPQS